MHIPPLLALPLPRVSRAKDKVKGMYISYGIFFFSYPSFSVRGQARGDSVKGVVQSYRYCSGTVRYGYCCRNHQTSWNTRQIGKEMQCRAAEAGEPEDEDP